MCRIGAANRRLKCLKLNWTPTLTVHHMRGMDMYCIVFIFKLLNFVDRVNVALSNFKEFAQSFHCMGESNMNPKDRCTVW